MLIYSLVYAHHNVEGVLCIISNLWMFAFFHHLQGVSDIPSYYAFVESFHTLLVRVGLKHLLLILLVCILDRNYTMIDT